MAARAPPGLAHKARQREASPPVGAGRSGTMRKSRPGEADPRYTPGSGWDRLWGSVESAFPPALSTFPHMWVMRGTSEQPSPPANCTNTPPPQRLTPTCTHPPRDSVRTRTAQSPRSPGQVLAALPTPSTARASVRGVLPVHLRLPTQMGLPKVRGLLQTSQSSSSSPWRRLCFPASK